jgi:uncharacterized protein (DUF58 family)
MHLVKRSNSLTSGGSQRLRLTSEGWWAALLTVWMLGSALISHASLMLLVFSILLAILVVSGLLTARNVRRLDAVRRAPGEAVAGRPFHVEYQVQNNRRVGDAQGLVLASSLVPAAEVERPAVFFRNVAPRREASQRVEVVVSRRGLYQFGPIELSSRLPWGFFERSEQRGRPQDLIVYPRLGKLRRRFIEAEQESYQREEGRRVGRLALDADYLGLREFRDGDSPRWIHWPTTARRGRLMAKEFEARHKADAVVLVDPWLPDRPGPRDHELLELAISFAATLCVELSQRHSMHIVLGIASDPPVLRYGQTSVGMLREALRDLALVNGTSQVRWQELIARLPPGTTTPVRVTAVSPRPLDLVRELGSHDAAMGRQWQRLKKRLVQVDVSSPELATYFELK